MIFEVSLGDTPINISAATTHSLLAVDLVDVSPDRSNIYWVAFYLSTTCQLEKASSLLWKFPRLLREWNLCVLNPSFFEQGFDLDGLTEKEVISQSSIITSSLERDIRVELWC